MQTILEAAARLGVSDRRVRKLCEQGRIAGARRIMVDGSAPLWQLPDTIAIRPGKRGPKLGTFVGYEDEQTLDHFNRYIAGDRK